MVMVVNFEEIAKGNFLRRERDFQVFTSEESFAPIRAAQDETRKVLWPEELVIGLFAGSKTTGGHGITVSRIEAAPPRLTIFFEEIPPRPGTMVTQAITFPGLLIAVKRKELPTGRLGAEFVTADKIVKRQSFILDGSYGEKTLG